MKELTSVVPGVFAIVFPYIYTPEFNTFGFQEGNKRIPTIPAKTETIPGKPGHLLIGGDHN
jgi:hypothetical protein